MKRIFLLLAIISILIGCSSKFNQAIAEAETALENEDFESALTYYELALEENRDNEEIHDIVDLLKNYEILQKEMENGKWTDSFDVANDLLKNGEAVPTLHKVVKNLMLTIEEEIEKQTQIVNELETIEKHINNDDLIKAENKLSRLQNELETDFFDDEIDELFDELSQAQQRYAGREQKEKEAEQKLLDEEAKQKEAKAKASNLRTTYLQKADSLHERFKRDQQKEYQNEIEWGEFIHPYFNEWDNLLNEVWGVLQDTMPSSAFESLRNEQRNWIETKDKNLEEMGPGDTLSNRNFGTEYLISETRERTYYLIENYMD